MPNVVYHGSTHRPFWVGGSDPTTPVGYYEIKLYPDPGHPVAILDPTLATVQVGDAQFVFAIPEDLDGARLIKAHAFVSTAGAVTVQVRNITGGNVDMLSTRVTIDAADYTSYDAGVPPVVNPANATVDTGDRIAIDIDAATGAKGLGVILVFATV